MRWWDGANWTDRFAEPDSAPAPGGRRRKVRPLLLVLTLAALIVAGAVAAVVVLGNTSSSEERIAFEGSDYESIRTVAADGSDYDRAVAGLGSLNGWEVSPDGSTVVLSATAEGSDARLYLVDLDSGDRIDIGRGVSPQFSPDGREVGYNTETGEESAEQSRVKVYDIASAKTSTLGEGYLIDFIPGGSDVLAGASHSEGDEYRSDVEILGPEGVVRTIEDASTAAVSPRGDRIAFVRDEGGEEDYEPVVYMTGPGDGSPVRIGDGDVPVFSPDGRWLAYTRSEGYEGEDSGVRLADVETGEEERLTEGEDPVFSPDGSTVVVERSVESGEEDYSQELRLIDVETGEEERLAEGEDAAFSADGKRLLYVNDIGGENWEPMLFSAEVEGGAETSLTEGTYPRFYEVRK